MARCCFVAGTDTGVGKTRVTCALLRAGRAAGHAAIGMKPVSAGVIEQDGRLINEDVLDIARASAIPEPWPLADLNPYALREPVSPHIAADRANISLDFATIVAASGRLRQRCELLLVEGAGGWHAPIDQRRTMADLARALGAPVLLVVGLKLGCLGHARLTRDAILASGLPLAGWASSEIDPNMLAKDENIAFLEAMFGEKAVVHLPHAPTPDGDAGHATTALARLLAPAWARATARRDQAPLKPLT